MRMPRCMPTTTRSTIAPACRTISRRMEQVAQKYPKDDEAQIAYAITLNVAASPADKTYANQLKGAALLEPIFKRKPQHPGVAHYLIHLYDYPAIAEKGLAAAKRYAKIAAAAPHAQHMPSHIFTRVGYWKELIMSNAESARVAKLDGEQHDQAHGMDYLVYAHLQLAQDKKAQGRDRRNERDRVQARPLRRALRGGGEPGALRGRARRLEGGGRASGAADQVPLCRCDHAFRACARRGTLRQSGGRQGRRRQARRAQRQAEAKPRMPIGRRSSASSSRSRAPGCCTPKASTTRRSRR